MTAGLGVLPGIGIDTASGSALIRFISYWLHTSIGDLRRLTVVSSWEGAASSDRCLETVGVSGEVDDHLRTVLLGCCAH